MRRFHLLVTAVKSNVLPARQQSAGLFLTVQGIVQPWVWQGHHIRNDAAGDQTIELVQIGAIEDHVLLIKN